MDWEGRMSAVDVMADVGFFLCIVGECVAFVVLCIVIGGHE